MQETELYPPVKQHLEACGYEVKAEVNGCDVVAVRGDEVLVVELKRRFNLELVFQGVERQRLTDSVYLAIEAPRGRRTGRWYDIQRLCRRLGLGLIAVRLDAGQAPGTVEVVCDPDPAAPRKTRSGRVRLRREFEARSGDHNVGGSTRRPIVTAYREAALRLAEQLRLAGPSSVESLREATGCARAGVILQKDHYGWFERVERGVYRLTPAGEAALASYSGVVAGWSSDQR